MTAWIAIAIARSVLALVLWRSGDRGWWTWCLIAATAKTGILALVSGENYWAAWIVLEPLAIGFRLMAVYEAVDRYVSQFPRSTSGRWWIKTLGGLAAAIVAFVSFLAPAEANVYRRATRILAEIGSAACLAPLLVNHAVARITGEPARHGWLTAYFALNVAGAIGESLAGAGGHKIVSAARLWTVAALYCGWTVSVVRPALLTGEAVRGGVVRQSGEREDGRDRDQAQ